MLLKSLWVSYLWYAHLHICLHLQFQVIYSLKQVFCHKLHLQYLKCHLWIFHVKSLSHVLSGWDWPESHTFCYAAYPGSFHLWSNDIAEIANLFQCFRSCFRGWVSASRQLFNRRIVKYTFIIYVDSERLHRRLQQVLIWQFKRPNLICTELFWLECMIPRYGYEIYQKYIIYYVVISCQMLLMY